LHKRGSTNKSASGLLSPGNTLKPKGGRFSQAF